MTESTAQPAAAAPPAERRRNWLLLLLIVVLVIALLGSLVAIGGYFLLSRETGVPQGWQDPLAAVDVTRVRPDIAILKLVDEDPVIIVQEALQAGEPDSAYAVLVSSPNMDAAARSGNLFLIASAFEEAHADDLAALSYQQIHSVAALSPTLPDFARAAASLDAAEGLVGLDRLEDASASMAQAEALARYSPLMAPVQQREIVQRLSQLYRQVGQDARADELGQLLREPQGVPPDDSAVRGPFLTGFQGQIVKPQQLVEVENERRRQALAFLEAWDATGGQDVEAARAALANALLLEDGLRQAILAAELDAATQLSTRVAWIQEHINWLSLKLMVATRGLGFSLVPEWEGEVDMLREQLAQAYGDLRGLYGEQIAALPEAADVHFADVELLRTQALAGQLGLYPFYPAAELAVQLAQAQAALPGAQNLRVIDAPWGDGLQFRIAEAF